MFPAGVKGKKKELFEIKQSIMFLTRQAFRKMYIRKA
jgi:hypothetical protein